jgi:hypothetical protein
MARSAWISFTRKDFGDLSSEKALATTAESERMILIVYYGTGASSERRNQISVERFGKLLKALLSEKALCLVESQIAQVTFCAVMSYSRFCPRDVGVCMFAK